MAWRLQTPNSTRTTNGFRAGFALVSLALVFLVHPPAALAVEESTHFFNAVHSLTGDCQVSAVDNVADPGCPGGSHPSAGPFVKPTGVAVDGYGDLYVAVNENEDSKSHVDVFDSSGAFVTELAVPGVRSVAVDSTGHLYTCGSAIQRLDPTVFDPQNGEISYNTVPTVIAAQGLNPVCAIATNPANDHFFVDRETSIREYGSAAEGNALITDSIGEENGTDTLYFSRGLAIDGAHEKIYAATFDTPPSGQPSITTIIEVFESKPPYAHLSTIDGSSLPGGKFPAPYNYLALAVDEEDGHLFAHDANAKKAFEFDADGGYVSTIT
ncbi:MAG TPA: hypothetical protein VN851_19015, partial [Thermoanaerobaculia bacterium]|nr:hypothetical protein [Thermoanaerobaculia bacterium]